MGGDTDVWFATISCTSYYDTGSGSWVKNVFVFVVVYSTMSLHEGVK